jgi:uncharacterized protein (TIGR02246 family)
VTRLLWRRPLGANSCHEPPTHAGRDSQIGLEPRAATMSVEDKLAIQEVIARYSYAYDSRDADAFAQLFVEDGSFAVIVPGESTPKVRRSSRAAIREWAEQRLQERTGRFTSRHYQSGILFDELTPGSALTRTMVLVTHQGVTEVAPRLTVSGIYHDQWRKTHEGWRLVHRTAQLDRDPGLLQR